LENDFAMILMSTTRVTVNAKCFEPSVPVVTRLVLAFSHRNLNLDPTPPSIFQGPCKEQVKVYDDMERSTTMILT